MKKDVEISVFALILGRNSYKRGRYKLLSDKKMIDTLELYLKLFGEGSTVPTNGQNNNTNAAGYTIEERAFIEDSFIPEIISPEPVPEMKDDIDPEILLLAKTYGPLSNGVKIELSLQEALQLFPRQRKRSDAYKSLIKKVKEQFNAELTIGTKKK